MAASTTPRPIDGEKAQRIVDAMRESVARRGVAGSTFDHVAGEARVSRGLLHYYFGTKERLLGEVVRRDCELRMAGLESQLATAASADAFVALLRDSLVAMFDEDPDFVTLIFELFTVSRHNEEIAVEFREVLRRTREHVAAMLTAKESEGVVTLHAPAEAISDIIFAIGDGLAIRMISEPDRAFAGSIAAGVTALRALITDG
jgi:AcrR family transcriptional regulator